LFLFLIYLKNKNIKKQNLHSKMDSIDMSHKSKESETRGALITKINNNTGDCIIKPTDKLTQAQPEALYHGGTRGAPPRGKLE